MSKVITLGGKIINRGDWECQVYYVDKVNRPFPGPLEAPDDWDYEITKERIEGNPLPEGAIEEDLDIFFDRQETLRRVDEAHLFERESRMASASGELSELLIDIQLGVASPEEVERARELRVFLKGNPLRCLST